MKIGCKNWIRRHHIHTLWYKIMRKIKYKISKFLPVLSENHQTFHRHCPPCSLAPSLPPKRPYPKLKNRGRDSNGFSKTSLCSDWSNSINLDQSDARKVGWLLLENSDWPIREDARSVDQWNWSCQPDTQQFQPSQAEVSSVNWAGLGLPCFALERLSF